MSSTFYKGILHSDMGTFKDIFHTDMNTYKGILHSDMGTYKGIYAVTWVPTRASSTVTFTLWKEMHTMFHP